MKLRFSPTSPYARKVRVVALERGFETLELIPTDTWNIPSELKKDNPLGKIPALVTDADGILYDSPVICEYLDCKGNGPRLYPVEGPDRWRALRMQALGDGMMDAAVERYVERMRPAEKQLETWDEHQRRAIERSLDHLEASSACLGGALTVGQIAVGCALGYLDLRFGDEPWRQRHPRLSAWYQLFAERPSMRSTAPPSVT